MKKTVLLLTLAAIANAANYQIDGAHSRAGFTVKHMMVTNVHGSFKSVAGTVEYDPKNLAATRLDVSIDPATIDTGEPKRDAHLRNPDFFDVAKYPVLTFKSTRVVKGSGAQVLVTGDLTMHGVTKPVVLTVTEITPEVKDAWGGTRFGASAQTKINRKDFGLTWNKALDGGGLVVSDEVNILLEMELVKKAPSAKSE